MQETVLLLHCLGGDAGVSAGIALPWRWCRGQCRYCIALEVMQETVLLLHCLGGDAGDSAGIALPWRWCILNWFLFFSIFDVRLSYHIKIDLIDTWHWVIDGTLCCIDWSVGKLIMCHVTGIAHRRPNKEQLEVANPVRNDETGLWQCPFCDKKDFPELSEVCRVQFLYSFFLLLELNFNSLRFSGLHCADVLFCFSENSAIFFSLSRILQCKNNLAELLFEFGVVNTTDDDCEQHVLTVVRCL